MSSAFQTVQLSQNTRPTTSGRQIDEQASRKNEVVDPIRRALPAGLHSEIADLLLPIRAFEFTGARNRRVPAAADHQEFVVRCQNTLQGGTEILQKNNVAIRITKNTMTRDGLCARKHIIRAIRTGLTFFRVRFMANPQFFRHGRRPFVVTKQNNFSVRMHQRPAFQSISLDNAAVPRKRFGGCEKCQHFRPIRVAYGSLPPSIRTDANAASP